jgi:hypothetical protein
MFTSIKSLPGYVWLIDKLKHVFCCLTPLVSLRYNFIEKSILSTPAAGTTASV